MAGFLFSRRSGNPRAAARQNAGGRDAHQAAAGRERSDRPSGRAAPPRERSREQGAAGSRAGRAAATRATERSEGGAAAHARRATATAPPNEREGRAATHGAAGKERRGGAAERSGDRGRSEAQQPRSRSGEQPGATGDPAGQPRPRRSGRAPAEPPQRRSPDKAAAAQRQGRRAYLFKSRKRAQRDAGHGTATGGQSPAEPRHAYKHEKRPQHLTALRPSPCLNSTDANTGYYPA